MTWAFDQELPPNEKLLLLAIADHADAEGFCYPGQRGLARKVSMSERTVRTLIGKLEERGVIIRERRQTETGQRRNDGYKLVPNWTLPAKSAGGPTGKSEGAYRQTVAGTEQPSEEPDNNKRARTLPEDWTPTAEHRVLAKNRGLDVEMEATLFKLHAEANDRKQVRWNAAFSSWLLNSRRSVQGGVPKVFTSNVPAAPKYPDAPPAADDGWEPYFPPPLEN